MNDADLAERLTRRRARLLPVFAILLIVQQGMGFSSAGAPPAQPLRVGAWLVLTVVLLAVFASGGGLARSAKVRALMNDDTTRAHRARACMLAFWNMMATGIVLYVLSAFKAFDGRTAVHIVMTVGLASALISFAAMERQALR